MKCFDLREYTKDSFERNQPNHLQILISGKLYECGHSNKNVRCTRNISLFI